MKTKLIYLLFFIFIFFSCKKDVIYRFNIINKTSKTIIANSNSSDIYHVIEPKSKKNISTIKSFKKDYDSIIKFDTIFPNLIVINRNGDSLKLNLHKPENWKLTIITNNISPIYSYDFLIHESDF